MFSRRDFLNQTGGGFGALALASLLHRTGDADTKSEGNGDANRDLHDSVSSCSKSRVEEAWCRLMDGTWPESDGG